MSAAAQPVLSYETDDPESAPLSSLAQLRARTIQELVASSPVSVRLGNSIARALRENRLPCQTLGDYIDAGKDAPVLFMRQVLNFGRRTALELDDLVRREISLARETGVVSFTPDPEPIEIAGPDPRREELLAGLEGMTLASALVGQLPSARLQNAMFDPEFGGRSIASLFSSEGSALAELMRRPNFGRKSAAELAGLCRAAVIRKLAQDYAEPESLVRDCALVFGEPAADLALANEVLQALDIEKPPQSLDELMEWGLQVLPAREREILVRRFGLDGEPDETLEEVGERLGVTRERIRQLEAKALGRLRKRIEPAALGKMLRFAAAAFWDQRERPYLLSQEICNPKRLLGPKLALAHELSDLPLIDWLLLASHTMAYGLLRTEVDPDQVRALARNIERSAAERPLPLPLVELGIDAEAGTVEAAVSLETRYYLFDGYLVQTKPRTRLKRAIRLHALLAAERRSCTLYELGALYASHAGSDRCNVRDLAIVMEMLPHLFVEVEDGSWAALGRSGGMPRPDDGITENETSSDVDCATMAGALQRAIEERGPTSIAELYRDGEQILPKGRARSGIAFILLGRPDLFVRILPSVFALPQQLLDEAEILEQPLGYLLNEEQARHYALARFAGERWGEFRLWTPAAEYRLLDWARVSAPPDLYRSLLAVASPDAWPVRDAIRSEWLQRKERDGRFELVVTGRAALLGERPAIDRVWAACRAAIECGNLGWTRVNRIMGRRLDRSGGQALLAMMLALGAVELPSDPEHRLLRPHRVTSRAYSIAETIGAQLLRSDDLDWSSECGRELLRQMSEVDSATLGWCPADEFALLVSDAAGTTMPPQLGREEDDEDEEDVVARLMREHRQASDRARRDRVAQWLLEG